jgi:hypothetical protein
LIVIRRRLKPSLLSLSWLFPLLALNGCRPRPVAPGLPAPSVPKAGVTKEKVRLEGADLSYKNPKGETLRTEKAKEGAGEVASMTATLKGVECVLYAANRASWTCKADTLTAEQPTKEIRLSGNVTGRSADGLRSFTAPTVHWDVEKAQITGGPRVQFRLGKVLLTGDRLVASTASQKGRVFGNVEGRVLP